MNKTINPSTDGVVKDKDLTSEDVEKMLRADREELAQAVAARQKRAEEELVDKLEKHLDNKDIPLATDAAIEFLTTVYGNQLLGIWGLRYYKRMTKGDITRFDKASTKLLQMRGDIK